MANLRLSFLFLLFLFGFLSGGVAAQNITGAILGTVTDASGAVIPGAKVTITNIATNQVIVVTTGADGNFQAPLLQPSNYQVKVVAQSFKSSVRDDVTLRVEDKLRLDFTLETG